MHKQFYKRVYLYAAMEIRGGYGSGNYYYYQKKTEYLPDNTKLVSHSNNNLRLPISRGTVDTAPFVGVKMLFKRISFGTEVSAIQTGVVFINNPAAYRSNYSVFDVIIGQFRQRLFVNFRF